MTTRPASFATTKSASAFENAAREPNRAPAIIYLLADHLDAALACGEDLTNCRLLWNAHAETDEDIASLRATQRRVISGIRTLEAQLVMRTLKARKRSSEVSERFRRFEPLSSLFTGGTAILADLASETAAAAVSEFETGSAQLAYLRSRGLVADDVAAPEAGQLLAVTDDFRLGGRIRLGEVLDLAATYLDALDIHFGLYLDDLDDTDIESVATPFSSARPPPLKLDPKPAWIGATQAAPLPDAAGPDLEAILSGLRQAADSALPKVMLEAFEVGADINEADEPPPISIDFASRWEQASKAVPGQASAEPVANLTITSASDIESAVAALLSDQPQPADVFVVSVEPEPEPTVELEAVVVPSIEAQHQSELEFKVDADAAVAPDLAGDTSETEAVPESATANVDLALIPLETSLSETSLAEISLENADTAVFEPAAASEEPHVTEEVAEAQPRTPRKRRRTRRSSN